MFPADNVWNTPVDALPVDGHSADYIKSIGANTGLHPDFGAGQWEGAPMGIPYVIVGGNQPKVKMTFEYAGESDPGPYPIPPNAQIEGGPKSKGDRHVLVLDRDNCKLYETWSSYPQPDGSWKAGSGAIFDLKSNKQRPQGWTSADAAGLPVLPGLARFDEVTSGEIKHALRFTCVRTKRAYVWPATHFASSKTDANLPPMGQRFRLKASFDVSKFSPQAQVLLKAMKKYGLILADNGSNWFISGAPDPGWAGSLVDEFRKVKGSEFEAVDCSSLMINASSGQARISSKAR